MFGRGVGTIGEGVLILDVWRWSGRVMKGGVGAVRPYAI